MGLKATLVRGLKESDEVILALILRKSAKVNLLFENKAKLKKVLSARHFSEKKNGLNMTLLT